MNLLFFKADVLYSGNGAAGELNKFWKRNINRDILLASTYILYYMNWIFTNGNTKTKFENIYLKKKSHWRNKSGIQKQKGLSIIKFEAEIILIETT